MAYRTRTSPFTDELRRELCRSSVGKALWRHLNAYEQFLSTQPYRRGERKLKLQGAIRLRFSLSAHACVTANSRRSGRRGLGAVGIVERHDLTGAFGATRRGC